jgi:hypothetical protein
VSTERTDDFLPLDCGLNLDDLDNLAKVFGDVMTIAAEHETTLEEAAHYAVLDTLRDILVIRASTS